MLNVSGVVPPSDIGGLNAPRAQPVSLVTAEYDQLTTPIEPPAPTVTM